jgi:glycosyltransferase involved in cell wall biosynthesis
VGPLPFEDLADAGWFMGRPRLSVIMSVYNARETIERCLSALEDQLDDARDEIIVADSSSDGTSGLIARRFPRATLYTFPERKYPGEARNFAIARSRGEILAFLDADTIPALDWAEQIIAAHAEADPVVGGLLDIANPESMVSWAHYFCEFSQWMVGTPAGETSEIPTACLSLKRWVFDQHGPFLEGTLSEDTAFNWRLAEGGVPRRIVPSIRVGHINFDRLRPFLRKQIIHGRFFARVRTREQGFSRPRRFLYAVGSPLLPFLLTYRILRRVRARRTYGRELARALPLVLLGCAGWAVGEMLGYLRTDPGVMARRSSGWARPSSRCRSAPVAHPFPGKRAVDGGGLESFQGRPGPGSKARPE